MDTLRGQHVPCCSMIVYQNHKKLFQYTAGFRDAAGTIPADGSETYNIFSCSKVMTTCAVMQLIGEGRLDPDDPVGKYLPAWANPKIEDENGLRDAGQPLTIRALMSMQGGLDYDLTAPPIMAALEKYGKAATTRQLIDALAEKPLHFEPMSDFMYSLCHDVLAAVVEVISGQRFSDYLSEHIWQPLGLKKTGFRFTEDYRKTQADMYVFEGFDRPLKNVPNDDVSYRLAPEYESGGAGLITDTEDYARFLDAIACGGTTAEGKVILSQEMIDLWRTPQLGAKSRATFDTWGRKGYSYALGVRSRVDPANGRGGPAGEFGWDGAAGAYLFIDPENRLSGFFTMHVLNFGYCYDIIHPTLQTLIYDGLNRP